MFCLFFCLDSTPLTLPESHFLTERSLGRIILLSEKIRCQELQFFIQILKSANLTFSFSNSSLLPFGSEVAVPGLLWEGVAQVILLRPFPSSRRRVALWIFAIRRSLLYSILLPIINRKCLFCGNKNNHHRALNIALTFDALQQLDAWGCPQYCSLLFRPWISQWAFWLP